jgi:hypothetical protein
MKVILLQNTVFQHRYCRAGEAIEVDEKTANWMTGCLMAYAEETPVAEPETPVVMPDFEFETEQPKKRGKRK